MGVLRVDGSATAISVLAFPNGLARCGSTPLHVYAERAAAQLEFAFAYPVKYLAL